jgi:hypothetical protein
MALVWELVVETHVHPGVCEAGMVYDPIRDEIIFHLGAFYPRTFSWSGVGNWVELFPAHFPNDRGGYAMGWDGSDVILFGGQDAITLAYLNDTWKWDGTDWTQLSPAASPPAYYHPEMSWNGSNLIWFGGIDFGGVYQNETWSWNGTNWSQLTPATSPSGRYLHPMAYDGSKILMFGGYNAGVLGDTWKFESGNWTQLTPVTSPPPRASAQLAWDGTAFVLFGGINSGFATIDDTWVWDDANNTWTECTGLSPKPSKRSRASFVYEPPYDRAVMHAGCDGGTQMNDTWLVSGTCGAVPPPPPALAVGINLPAEVLS